MGDNKMKYFTVHLDDDETHDIYEAESLEDLMKKLAITHKFINVESITIRETESYFDE